MRRTTASPAGLWESRNACRLVADVPDERSGAGAFGHGHRRSTAKPRSHPGRWSVAASAAIVALLVYVPQLHEPFGTYALGAAELGAAELVLVLLFAVLPAVLVEASKAVGRLRGYAGNPQNAPSVPGWRTRGHT